MNAKIPPQLLAKIQAEPDQKIEVLLRLNFDWFVKEGIYLSEQMFIDLINTALGFWDRRFGNFVFIELMKAYQLDLYYLVVKIKASLIPKLEKLDFVEAISEQKMYHAVDVYLDLPQMDIPALTPSRIFLFKPTIHQTLGYLGFDKIHKDQRFIDKGLGKDGRPAGIADTGVSTGTGEKWTWLYENPEGLPSGKQGKYRILEAKDFSYPPLTPTDKVGHGSHIANIMASAGKKYLGCVPQGRLYVAKVLNDQGYGFTSWIIKGIDWLLEKGCCVINLSLGADENTDGTDELSVACDRAWEKDVYVAIAIGNNGGKTAPYCDGTIGTPACSKKCAITGATSGIKSQPEKTQYWSSRPPTKDGRKFELKYVVAPGLQIEGYDSRMSGKSGSSFGDPWHTGEAWALRIVHPDWTNEQVWLAIKNTAIPLGYKDAYGKEEGFCLEGYGRIDPWAAYNYQLEPTPPPTPPTPELVTVTVSVFDGKLVHEDHYKGNEVTVSVKAQVEKK